MHTFDPWYISLYEIVFRLGLALFLGGAIGFEREKSNRAAGFRTNILVCMGSALIMLLSMYGFTQFTNEFNVRMDPARLAAQVISGIGFLGAGVILFNGYSITGLTTAATLWVVAGIGLSVGAGFYIPSVVATLLVLFSLLILNKIERKWISVRKKRVLHIKAEARDDTIMHINRILQSLDLSTKNIQINRESFDESILMIKIDLKTAPEDKLLQMMERLHLHPEISSTKLE